MTDKKKILVAYFSAAGATAKAAKRIADATGLDIYEIKPVTPYTQKDLNWKNILSRSMQEMIKRKKRPLLADYDAKIENYDVILLGFPIWCAIAPTIVNTFLESYNFTGKRIVLFATSGGSKLGNSAKRLKDSAPGAVIEDGRMMNDDPSDEQIKAWINSL